MRQQQRKMQIHVQRRVSVRYAGALVLLLLACVVLFPTATSAASVDVDVPGATIGIESWAVPGLPNDPNRCITEHFVEFPDLPGAGVYTAVVLNQVLNANQTFHAGPSVFPDDERTISVGGLIHVFRAPAGKHRIILGEDSSGSGCTSASRFSLVSMKATFDNPPPVASFTWAAQNDAPLTVDFDASGSTDDKGIASWNWDFGDGQTGSGETTSHPFAASGTYSVTLTVADAEGQEDTETHDVTVSCSSGPPSSTMNENVRSAAAQEGCELELDIAAVAPRPQGVQRTERIDYTLDSRVVESGCGCPLAGEVDELVVSATVPTDFVTVDKASITEGGVLSSDGSTVEWTFPNEAETPTLAFSVTVRSDAPRSVLFISTQARAHASLASGVQVSANRLAQTPLLQFGLVLLGEIASERGDHVVPGQVATVRIQADARDEADAVELDAFVPKGSNVVSNSITHGGVQNGERFISWKFENMKETPIVEFQIKVDALKDLPKDLKKLSAKTTAQATFAAIPESAENTLEIAVVRPTTIRGVVHDIVQGAPSRLQVTTPPGGAGIQVKLSELLSGKVVDKGVTNADGTFSVEAGKPMGYVLEAIGSVPMKTRGGATQLVRSKHILDVRENGDVYVDNRLAPTREDGSLAPLDVYVPVSLVKQTDTLIASLGSTEIQYWLVMKINIAPVLDFLNSLGVPFTDVRFDTDEVTSVLDAAVDMRGTQVRNDGYPAHFNGLYEPGNPATERDGWNGLIRLNAMLAQLGAVSSDPKRLGDALTIIRPIALAIALQVTTTVVKAIGKKLGTPRAGAKWRFYRIAFMSDVVGTAAPYAIDFANWLGGKIDKAKWMEWFAKGSRYGMDIMMGFLEKGAKWWTLFDDLTFEAIFNAVRVGVTGIMLDGWINLMAQKSLDQLGFLQSTFAGSTSAIDQYVLNADSRLSSGVFSAANLQKLSTVESNVVSAVRTLDGLMIAWKGAYGSKTPPSIPKIEALRNWLDTKFAGPGGAGQAFQRWVVVLNALAIETGVVGLEALGLEVQNIAGALTLGPPASARHVPATTPTDSVHALSEPAANPATSGDAAVPTSLRSMHATSRWSARSLRSATASYRLAAVRLAAALAHPKSGRVRPVLRVLDRASVRVAAALEPGVRRSLLVQAKVDAQGRQRVAAFLDASHELADAQLVANERLDAITAADLGSTRAAVGSLVARIGAFERALASAGPALARGMPGSLLTTPVDIELPGDNAILSGKPFDARITLWNAGDTPTAPASVELTSADGLEVVSRAVTQVPRLRAGQKVTLSWRLRATGSRRAVLASHAQLVVTRGQAIVANVDLPVFAFAAPPSN